MEPKLIRVMGPPPASGTRYFDLDRFLCASGVAEQHLRNFITGLNRWKTLSMYVIGMVLRDAAEVEHGISCSREEIVRLSPPTPITSYQLYEGAPARQTIVAHEVLWLEHRSFIERLRSHWQLLGEAPDEQAYANFWKQAFDMDEDDATREYAFKRLAELREAACRPVDAKKCRRFRSAMMRGLSPSERAFEALFLNVGVERDRVTCKCDPPIMLGTRSAVLIDNSDEAAPARKTGDVHVTLNPPQVTIDGQAYSLTPAQATYLDELLKSPRDWMSDPEFRRRRAEVGENARPDKWRKKMPSEVLLHIEIHRSRGTRWKP